jgi:hypothetical protein
MIEGTDQVKESNASAVMKFLIGRLRMKAWDTRIWSVIAVIIISLLLFWTAALVYAYVAGDRSAEPADERSLPAPRSH